MDRTKDDGKTSAIHFIRFSFSADQVAIFNNNLTPAQLVIDHPAYGHIAIFTAENLQAPASDFDPV